MNDNQPQPPASYPLDPHSARHLAEILAKADGSGSMERLFGELKLLSGYQLTDQDNGMVALSRLAGEGSLLLFPTSPLIPMLAETVLKFMVPSALHKRLVPGMSATEIAQVLAGGTRE